MTASNHLNLWTAATTAERDLLGSEAGVSPGDFCLVEGVNLYVATTVLGMSSRWRPLAGVPTEGPVAVGGRNHSAANQAIYEMTTVSFRAVLDQPPSSVTLVMSSSVGWPTANLSAAPFGVLGFYVYGDSDPVPPGAVAVWRGHYTITY